MIIPIDEGDALYLRRLMFEIDSYKTIISVLANCDSHSEWHDKKYEEVCKEIQELNAEYGIVLDYIKAKYVPIEKRKEENHMHIDLLSCRIRIEECDNDESA